MNDFSQNFIVGAVDYRDRRILAQVVSNYKIVGRRERLREVPIASNTWWTLRTSSTRVDIDL